MAAADEDERGGAVAQRPAQAGQVGGDRGGEQFDAAGAGAQDLRDARLQRAEVDAVRVGEEPLQASVRTGRAAA
ncbi:hypothetical protein SCYAM73S_03344 [Streptomyces cyaneofuscatus]